MAKVSITLDDGDEGQFKCFVDYFGEFEVSSHAHQHGLLLTKHLDSMADHLGVTDQMGVTHGPETIIENAPAALAGE